MKQRRGYWIAGTLVAFAGVGIARLVPGIIAPETHSLVVAAGIVCAFAGLFIITLGTRIRRR